MNHKICPHCFENVDGCVFHACYGVTRFNYEQPHYSMFHEVTIKVPIEYVCKNCGVKFTGSIGGHCPDCQGRIDSAYE